MSPERGRAALCHWFDMYGRFVVNSKEMNI
jgi:hypothetical protein